ncbi:hypothetical protein IWW51_003841, partial [Coemansia sp. RSA 2702]
NINSILYQAESIIANFYQLAAYGNNTRESIAYSQLASRRRQTLIDLAYNPQTGLFADYHISTGQHADIWSINSLWSFWAFSDTLPAESAHSALESLSELHDKFPGGLPNTFYNTTLLWDWPNVQSPLQHMAIQSAAKAENHPIYRKHSGSSVAAGIAQSTLGAAFCNWYTTGGSIDGVLNSYDHATGSSAGASFGSYAIGADGNIITSTDSSDPGDYAWSNAVTLWIFDQYKSQIQIPTCPNIKLNIVEHTTPTPTPTPTPTSTFSSPPPTSTYCTSSNTQAYSWALLEQLCARENALAVERRKVRVLGSTVELAVKRARQVLRLRRELQVQRQRIAEQRRLVEQRARRVEEASGANESLIARISETPIRRDEATRQQIERLVVKLRQDRIILEDLRAMLARQRAHVASELAFVYPIDLSDDGWVICGLRLARADDIRGWASGEQTAAALGMVSAVVDQIAQSMGVPIRFPVIPRGSRSVIINPSSATVQTAPLFMLRASDRPRLRTAMRQLAADIEQLLCMFGINDIDRHQVLPNLTQLL